MSLVSLSRVKHIALETAYAAVANGFLLANEDKNKIIE